MKMFTNVRVQVIAPLCDKITCLDTGRSSYVLRNAEGTRFWVCTHNWEKVQGGRRCRDCTKFDRQYSPEGGT